jgi:ketosteroid isomerase-like protein
MNEQQNTKTVQDGYAFFGKGDIPNLLKLYTDDIEFIVPGPKEVVPFAGVYRGKEQVANFFATLHDSMDFERFEPIQFIAQDDTVVAVGYGKARARSTGNTQEEEWAHVFRIRDGKVARFQVFTDTAAVVKAFQPSKQMAL